MPVKVVEFPKPVAVRLTNAQSAKLNRLAAMTGRPRGAIIRLLIERAHLSGVPDIQLMEFEVHDEDEI